MTTNNLLDCLEFNLKMGNIKLASKYFSFILLYINHFDNTDPFMKLKNLLSEYSTKNMVEKPKLIYMLKYISDIKGLTFHRK